MDGQRRIAIQTESGCGVGRADLSGEASRFLFERTNREPGTICPVAEILAAPLLESAGAFALRDVNEIVQDRFAIVPRIPSDNQSVTKTHAACVIGDDADALRGLGQARIFWKRNPIDHQHSNPFGFFDAGKFGVSQMPAA